jgi:hypothetical protein
MLNGDKELQALLANIAAAFNYSGLNGHQLGILDKSQIKLLTFGVKSNIRQAEENQLNQIFAEAGVHRDWRTL